jgi:hypothetical protein
MLELQGHESKPVIAHPRSLSQLFDRRERQFLRPADEDAETQPGNVPSYDPRHSIHAEIWADAEPPSAPTPTHHFREVVVKGTTLPDEERRVSGVTT